MKFEGFRGSEKHDIVWFFMIWKLGLSKSPTVHNASNSIAGQSVGPTDDDDVYVPASLEHI